MRIPIIKRVIILIDTLFTINFTSYRHNYNPIIPHSPRKSKTFFPHHAGARHTSPKSERRGIHLTRLCPQPHMPLFCRRPAICYPKRYTWLSSSIRISRCACAQVFTSVHPHAFAVATLRPVFSAAPGFDASVTPFRNPPNR